MEGQKKTETKFTCHCCGKEKTGIRLPVYNENFTKVVGQQCENCAFNPENENGVCT